MRWKKKSEILKCSEKYYIKTMKTYCVSDKKNIANKNFSVRRTKQNRLMLVSDCAVWG